MMRTLESLFYTLILFGCMVKVSFLYSTKPFHVLVKNICEVVKIASTNLILFNLKCVVCFIQHKKLFFMSLEYGFIQLS